MALAMLSLWSGFITVLLLLSGHELVMCSYGNTARKQGRYVPGRQVPITRVKSYEPVL